MATVASSARHSSDSDERGLNRVAVVIDAKDVLCRCLTLVSVAHLGKHLLSCRACTDIEHAGYPRMGLA